MVVFPSPGWGKPRLGGSQQLTSFWGGPRGRGGRFSALPPLGPVGGGGAGLTGHLLPCRGHRATWLHGSSSGFLKDRHGGEGWGVGSNVNQPPDLSLRLRQQQLPLPQNLAEDDGDARLFIFPQPGPREPRQTRRAGTPGGRGRVSHLGLLGEGVWRGTRAQRVAGPQGGWHLQTQHINKEVTWSWLGAGELTPLMAAAVVGGGGHPALPESCW